VFLGSMPRIDARGGTACIACELTRCRLIPVAGFVFRD
jgi:hypothetical protein